MIIQPVTLECIPEVLTFVLNARAELFPKLSASGVPDDLARFEATYIQGDGRFLVVRHDDHIVAATAIAGKPGSYSSGAGGKSS